MKYCMIECAFNSIEEIEKTAKLLLDNKLVASTQIVESNSSWNWQNEREHDKEYLLIMKTKKSLIKEIYKEIRNIHTYDCFELAIFDLQSPNEDYLNWIDESTK